jgi:uncharacterized peroxidase-related enzyme
VPERISRFTVPELANVPEDVRNRILAVQEKAGFVPNVFLMLAHRPAEFRAFFDYHDALMEKDLGLTKGERESMVVIPTIWRRSGQGFDSPHLHLRASRCF